MAVDLIRGEVPHHWEFTTLGEVCKRGGGSIQTGPFGSQLHASDYVPVGVPSIMPTNIGENRIIEDGIVRISEDDAVRLSQHRLKAGDIVYSRRGDVEKRALIREREEGWLCGTGCLKVRLGSNVVDPLFASLFLGHPAIREWIVRHAVGATMPNLNTSIMSAVPFALPPLAEQKAIAAALGALDDKIELNRRMNATLEATARALFQSWFVDFDPVRANLNGRSPNSPDSSGAIHFPATYQDSVVGRIPFGWRVGVLDDLIKSVIGGDWGATEQNSEETVSCYCIRGADIPSLQSGGIGKMPTRFLKPSSVDKRQLADGDLSIEISGGSPTQCTGRPVLVSDALIQELGRPLVASNFCRIVKLQSPAYSKFIYLWLRWMYDAGELSQFETGTTGIKNFAFTIFSAKFPLVVPDLSVAEAFDRAVSPFFLRIQVNSRESRVLTTLRDTLLPGLLSGSLSIQRC